MRRRYTDHPQSVWCCIGQLMFQQRPDLTVVMYNLAAPRGRVTGGQRAAALVNPQRQARARGLAKIRWAKHP